MIRCEEKDADCPHEAREVLLYKPSEAMVLDGPWESHFRCGQGTHRAHALARAILAYDKQATLLEMGAREPLATGVYEAVRESGL